MKRVMFVMLIAMALSACNSMEMKDDMSGDMHHGDMNKGDMMKDDMKKDGMMKDKM